MYFFFDFITVTVDMTFSFYQVSEFLELIVIVRLSTKIGTRHAYLSLKVLKNVKQRQ